MSPSIVYVSREAPVAAVRRLACLEGGAQSRVTSDCDLTCGAEKVLVMNALEALAGAYRAIGALHAATGVQRGEGTTCGLGAGSSHGDGERIAAAGTAGICWVPPPWETSAACFRTVTTPF